MHSYLFISCSQNLQERQREFEERLQEASSTIHQIDEYKAIQEELEARIKALESEKLELSTQLSSEAQDRDKKYEQDIEAYKEQNKQHSVTICAMEERLIKLMKKNKDYQEEITVLKKTIQGNELLKVKYTVRMTILMLFISLNDNLLLNLDES